MNHCSAICVKHRCITIHQAAWLCENSAECSKASIGCCITNADSAFVLQNDCLFEPILRRVIHATLLKSLLQGEKLGLTRHALSRSTTHAVLTSGFKAIIINPATAGRWGRSWFGRFARVSRSTGRMRIPPTFFAVKNPSCSCKLQVYSPLRYIDFFFLSGCGRGQGCGMRIRRE